MFVLAQHDTYGGIQAISLSFGMKIARLAQFALDVARDVVPGGEVTGVHRHRVVAGCCSVAVAG